ncbi:MAG: flagellar brake domain-containing protein [Lachnospiraceae bacterium]
MIADTLLVGDKIDIIPIKEKENNQNTERRVYYSQIQNIMSNGFIEINMPLEAGRLLLLPLNARYDLVFYTKKGTYTSIGEVKERYKKQNIYMLRMELKTELSKFQRREYFRCSCLIEFEYHALPEIQEEEQKIHEVLKDYIYQGRQAEMLPGIIVDISGGGVRFISKVENESKIYIRLIIPLLINEQIKVFHIAGKLISCEKVRDKKDCYENRVQFVGVSNVDREQIIKFIFDEERRARKRNNEG